MRICFVNQHSELSGGDISLFHLIRGLLPRVGEINVILPHDGPFSEWYSEQGVRVHYAPQPSLAINARAAWIWTSRFPASLLGIMRILRKIRPDIVHTNSAKNLYGPLAARMLGLPHVLHVRNTYKEPRLLYQGMGLIALLCSDVVIAASESVRELFPGAWGFSDRVFKVHNGVDLNRFHPGVSGAGFRQELGISDSELIVGVVSHMNTHKGQHVALESFARIAGGYPNCSLVLVGNPSPGYGELLAEMSARHGLSNRVRLMPGRPDIPEVMAGMDIIVFPSLYEAFPRTVIEALAMGRPLVASAVGGVPEAVEHGSNGLLFPPGDIDALAGCLEDLLNNPQTRIRFGAAARFAAERRFSTENCTEQVYRIYEELLQKRSGRATSVSTLLGSGDK